MSKPNVLFVMTDQQRFDTIAALGAEHVYTPNLDRLVRRGVALTRAYSTCPVCVPARCTIRTGCEPPTTRIFTNGPARPRDDQPQGMEDRCGPYLPRVMAGAGYRTFGIGKFHTTPVYEDLGYEVKLHAEELYAGPEGRAGDAYAAFIAREHPQFAFVEMLMGERTEMYYMPQMSPLPAELGAEAWAADRAVEQIAADDGRPFFGMVSFIGPHPPFAPPLPFNRMYDPDRMGDPVCGDLAVDHMDVSIPHHNHYIWADGISNARARVLKARYYGEISYIDACLGRILDAVEARPDADNTLICFFSDHGDHMGDHHAWQKETFFDAACHIPFLLSWPARLAGDTRREEFVCLTDLFGVATSAAGASQPREGIDVLAMLDGRAQPREHLIGYYGVPGSDRFKIMVRCDDWKYIFMANGGREQLFNLADDPHELRQRIGDAPDVAERLRGLAAEAVRAAHLGDGLEALPARTYPPERIYQFDRSAGVHGFPDSPEDVLGP